MRARTPKRLVFKGGASPVGSHHKNVNNSNGKMATLGSATSTFRPGYKLWLFRKTVVNDDSKLIAGLFSWNEIQGQGMTSTTPYVTYE